MSGEGRQEAWAERPTCIAQLRHRSCRLALDVRVAARHGKLSSCPEGHR